VTNELGTITNRFTSTSEEMRLQASRAAAEIAAEQGRLREQMERLPLAAQESSESMRRALQDQIKALDQLSALTARTAAQRDVTQPGVADGPPPPLHAPSGQETARSLTSLSSTIAQEMGGRPQRPARASRGAAPDGRESWSLGDLLARASRDEEGAPHSGGQTAFNLDLATIARALDTATAAAIWTRLRAGQRGVMVRSIYSEQGRTVFDDTARRCRAEPELGRTIGRYLADFERIISESDLKDPSGHLTQSHLVSDAGRVYLFLGHAYGRIS
jgi:predicted pyridoxine 5'-phosphate oxidase superfamily flavin-nucleotide-binding protein